MNMNQITRIARLTNVLTQVPGRTIYPHLSSNVIASPPRIRIPLIGKMTGSLIIAACIFATPCYVLTHLDDFRGKALERE